MPQLDSPIILFCSERSGSNMIAKIFDAHPQICAPGASHLFRVMSECACRFKAGSDELRMAVVSLFRAKSSVWSIDAWSDEDLLTLLRPLVDAGDMAVSLYNEEANSYGKNHILTKENSSFKYLPMLLTHSIQPRILFMVRDPRDVAVSWTNGPVMRGGALRATDRWTYDQNGYMATIAQLGEDIPVAFTRYEDILLDPAAELQRICEKLKLPFKDSMLRFSQISKSARADAARSAMWSNLDKPILSENTQKFRRELDDDQIAYIEAVAAPLMASLGYVTARSGQPQFGRFETLDALRAHLAASEPHEKPEYYELPAQERARFERWSRLVNDMRARAPLAPTAQTSEGA